jgi:PAS domain S-box-containing protein
MRPSHQPIRLLTAIACLIGVVTVRLSAQSTSRIDSLQQVYATSAEAETRFNALNDIAREYRLSFPDSTVYYSNKAIEQGAAHGYRHQLALPYNIIGVIYKNRGDFSQAYVNYQKALSLSLPGDSLQAGHAHNNIGRLYLELGDEKNADFYLDQATVFFTSIKDYSGLGYLYINLAEYYSKRNQLDSALLMAEKSYQLRKERKDKRQLLTSIGKLVTLHRKKKQFDQAMKYVDEAHENAKSANDKTAVAGLEFDYAQILFENHQTGEAKKHLSHVGHQFSKINNPALASRYNLLYGKILLEEGNETKAISHLKLVADEKQVYLNATEKENALDLLVELFEKQGNKVEGEKYSAIRESWHKKIENKNLALELKNLNAKFNIGLLENQNQELALANQKEKTQAVAMGFIIFFLITAAMVAYFSYKRKEKRKMKNALRKRKNLQRFEAIFNSSFQFTAILDETGKLLDVNDMVLMMGGFNSDQIKDKFIWDTPYWTDKEEAKTNLTWAIERALKGKVTRYEAILKPKEEEVFIDFSMRPVFDDQGKIMFLVAEGKDITKRKRHEEQIQKLLEFQNILLDSSDYSIHTISHPEGIITSFNRGAEKLFGYAASEVIGKSTPLLFHDENEIERQAKRLEKELNVPVKPGIEIFQMKGLHGLDSDLSDWASVSKNGSTFTLEKSLTTLRDMEGRITGYLCIGKDITERKQHEEQIQKLLDFQNILINSTDHAIISTSQPDGIITSFNKGAERMLGYTATEVVGKVTPAIYHDKEEVALAAEKLSKELNRPITSGLDVFHIKAMLGLGDSSTSEWTCYRKDGMKFTFELALTALRDSENKITGFMGIGKDITERKRMEMEIRMAKAEAEMANAAKSEFLASMSHEIRTPMNGVIGFSDLLLNTALDETQRQYVVTLNQSAHGLMDIINDVLDFSKIEAGKLDLLIEKSNLHELVRVVTDTVSFQAKKKNLSITLNLSLDVPRFIWADPVRVRQVLINLLSNAVKFTEKGSIELKVTGEEIRYSEYRLLFSVTDTGVGIKPENQKKIFLAFSQEDATTTKKYGGTGLGLSISNKLLGLMGSKLELVSKVGKGSTFYFVLVCKAEQSVDGMVPQDKEKTGSGKIFFQSADIKILLAEDNAVNMSLLKIILKSKFPNATLVEATNGKIAVEKFIPNEFDLVFMDVQMPIMDGLDATREIRRLEANPYSVFGNRSELTDHRSDYRTPIIALTANTMKGDIDKCLQAGMDDFMSKPILDEKMVSVLSKWLPDKNGNEFSSQEFADDIEAAQDEE